MTLKDMRLVILKDEETKDLIISDLDVLKVYQYLMDKHDQTEYDGYLPVLVTNPYIEIVYRPTKEKAYQLKQLKLRKYLSFFDSDIYIQHASLDDFHEKTEHRKTAKKTAEDSISVYLDKKVTKGLYIHGPYGSGKSYLLSAIAASYASHDVDVIFTYVPDLIRGFKQGIDEGTIEKRINILKQTAVLILDDLGGEFHSSWFRDEILMPLIQYRLSASLPVYVSSNYALTELADVLATGHDEVNRVKALRLIKRLRDLMTLVKLT
jgi:primosomal protein DnaI